MDYIITIYTNNTHTGVYYQTNIKNLEKNATSYELTYKISQKNAIKFLENFGYDKLECYASGDIIFKKNSNDFEDVKEVLINNFCNLLNEYNDSELDTFKIYFTLIGIKNDCY
jgi:hypothetical protein